jgi:hypothetical protein
MTEAVSKMLFFADIPAMLPSLPNIASSSKLKASLCQSRVLPAHIAAAKQDAAHADA